MSSDPMRSARILSNEYVHSILHRAEIDLKAQSKTVKSGLVSPLAVQHAVNQAMAEYIYLQAREEMGLVPPWEKADQAPRAALS